VINEARPALACRTAESVLSPKDYRTGEEQSDLSQAFAAPLLLSHPENKPAPAPETKPAPPLVFSPSAKELEKRRHDSKDLDGAVKQTLNSQESGSPSGSTPFGKDVFQSDNHPSQFNTLDCLDVTKRQKYTPKKAVVKDFVQTMVKGRQLTAVMPTGKTRGCFCSINRKLDTFSIRRHDKDKQCRHVLLVSIIEIVLGADTSKSSLCEGLDTPLDDLSITLVLDSEECLTFHMDDTESRDRFSSCLSMFARQKK
jgi:hypothetical protein